MSYKSNDSRASRTRRCNVTNITIVVAETHIQLSRTREDGTTTLKRQKMRAKTPRSKSVPDQPRKPVLAALDYTGCNTDAEIEQRNELYWKAPDFAPSRSLKYNLPRTPESISNEESDHHAQQLHRRHSDSILSPKTPESLSNRFPNQDIQSIPALHTTINTPCRSKTWKSAASASMSLDEQMNFLLLTPEDDKESPVLQTSQLGAERRKRLVNERKIKQREAAARAAKELRLTRRYPRKDLVHRLEDNWEHKVRRVEYTNNHHQVIATSIGGTELRLKDFQSLLGSGAWLNDEIVNSYLEWIVDAANNAAIAESKDREEAPGTVPRFIAHNSFFYNNLDSKGPGSTERLMKRKKAAGTSLMEVDSVFVPICKGNHWTVGVVRPIAKTIEYFDSFGGSSNKFIGLMRSWLKFQLGDSYVEEEWTVPNTKCARQSNGYDCGVFVCTNSLCVALGLDTSCYQEYDMRQQRRNIAAVLINRGFIGDFEWGKEGF